MNKNTLALYLTELGMTEPLIQRAGSILNFYISVCAEEIADVHVNDLIREDGEREWQSLWFFSENYIMEAREFTKKDDFDLAVVDRIHYWRIQQNSFDFSNAMDASRLLIEFGFLPRNVGELKAARKNCEQLARVFKKHIVPKVYLSPKSNDEEQ